MTYCDGSDLSAIYKRARSLNKTIKESVILNYFVQMVLGLDYLHRHNIIHRDVKSPNMFLLGNGRLVVGDLGISKSLDGKSIMAKTALGTPYYMAPEIFMNKPYDFKVDVWGCGCILYELAALHHPFEANSLAALSASVTSGNYQQIPKRYSKELNDLIRSLLNVDKEKRPTLSEVLKSDFIKPKLIDFICDIATRPADFSGDGTMKIKSAILGAVNDFYICDNKDMMNAIKTQLTALNLLDEINKRVDFSNECIKNPQNIETVDHKKDELSYTKEKTTIIQQALARVKQDKKNRDNISHGSIITNSNRSNSGFLPEPVTLNHSRIEKAKCILLFK